MTTRRTVVKTLAGLPGAVPIASVASTTAAATPDPIFAAIDAFRRAYAEYMTVEGDIPDGLGDRHLDAYDAVLRTHPTTPAGLVALTTWAREQADWLCANASVIRGEDLVTLIATIDDAARGINQTIMQRGQS
jgi:hypothetical protein